MAYFCRMTQSLYLLAQGCYGTAGLTLSNSQQTPGISLSDDIVLLYFSLLVLFIYYGVLDSLYAL